MKVWDRCSEKIWEGSRSSTCAAMSPRVLHIPDAEEEDPIVVEEVEGLQEGWIGEVD